MWRQGMKWGMVSWSRWVVRPCKWCFLLNTIAQFIPAMPSLRVALLILTFTSMLGWVCGIPQAAWATVSKSLFFSSFLVCSRHDIEKLERGTLRGKLYSFIGPNCLKIRGGREHLWSMFCVRDPRFSTQPAPQARCFPWRDTADSCLHELVGRMETLFCHARHNALPHISFCLPDKWTVEGNLLHSISFSSYGWSCIIKSITSYLESSLDFTSLFLLVEYGGFFCFGTLFLWQLKPYQFPH